MVFKSAQADTIPSGSSGSLLFYNYKTDTAQVITITNTTGKTIYPYSSGPMLPVARDKTGNIYISGADGILAKFDSTGALVKVYDGLGGNAAWPGMITPEIPYTAAGNSAAINMIYGADARPTNGSMPAKMVHFAGIDALCRQNDARASLAGYLIPYKNPLYLATINNLDSAITKDSTQTMKIIYTLTEASS